MFSARHDNKMYCQLVGIEMLPERHKTYSQLARNHMSRPEGIEMLSARHNTYSQLARNHMSRPGGIEMLSARHIVNS